jgi:hypothetical protein
MNQMFTALKSLHSYYAYRQITVDENLRRKGLTMQSIKETTTVAELKAAGTQDAVKDAGRVRIGGGAIHYGDATLARDATKDSGRVRIGGGAIHYGDVSPARDATKDSGRVRIGGGAIHYGDVTPARDAIKDSGRVRMGGGAICF